MQFIYVLPGWEGSAHDGHVLRDAISRDDGLKIPQGCYYLVDAGYCNAPGFLAPFEARNVIERCFGLLKGRWKILASPLFFPIGAQVRIILACCLLHNLIRKYMSVDPLEFEQDEEDQIEGEEPSGDEERDASTLRDIEFEGMTLTGLLKKLKGACQFPIKGIYFLIHGKELSNGLVEIKDDSNLAECIALAFKNEKLIEIYLEHHGYDLSHWVETEIEDDEVSDVGEMENITPYGVDTRYKVVHDVLYLEFDPSLQWNEMKPILSLRFEHPEQLKECLTNFGVANGYQLWYKRNDNQNLMVLCGRDIAEGRCGGKKGKAEGVQSPGKKGKKGVQSPGKKGKGVESTDKKGKGVESTGKKGKCIKKTGVQKGCTFRLWASWMQNGSCFQIKTLIPEHCCSRNFDLGSLVTYKWIAKQFAFKIIKDPTISYRSIQELTKKKFLINVSISQCKRAKQRALFDHEGGLIEHYSRLWDYRQQLLDTNPGSTVHLQIEEKENGQKHFLRFYVCFKAMKEGWSAGCRKVIGLDGCFLKGTVKGELLTAMGRDGNNQMFPIAWAVVNIENNDNWQWFLACICEDLMLGQGAYLTIISDGHKGLMEAVRTMLPYAEHRQYARHIYANFKKKWNEAKPWLVDRNPNNWCRAFFKMDRGCGAYENGISESYHNSIRIAKVGGSAMWPNTREDPPLLPVQRKMPGRPRKLRIKHVTKRGNVISRSGKQMTCQVCWQKGHNKKTCKNEPQPKPTKEKKKPGRKKAGDAGPSTAAGSATVVDESGPTGVDESGQTVVDESGVEVQMEATVTEDPIQEFETEIPTQTSRTSMKEVVEASIAAGTLKLAGVKRRSKSERIANKAKAFKFGKDGAGSSADKAWGVDEVLAEP
ncbi:calcium/proton exchanger [Tanacetum coccineum]